MSGEYGHLPQETSSLMNLKRKVLATNFCSWVFFAFWTNRTQPCVFRGCWVCWWGQGKKDGQLFGLSFWHAFTCGVEGLREDAGETLRGLACPKSFFREQSRAPQKSRGLLFKHFWSISLYLCEKWVLLLAAFVAFELCRLTGHDVLGGRAKTEGSLLACLDGMSPRPPKTSLSVCFSAPTFCPLA